jgi:hypothetical protein
MAHGVIEYRDHERMVAVIVEDDEVAGLNLMGATEPPLSVVQVRHADAVK